MKNKLIVFSPLLLCSCISIPSSTPIHDDFITLVAEDSLMKHTILYKNEKLNHYMTDGIDSYCKVPSMDSSRYRCFAISKGALIKGFDPFTHKWEELEHPIYLKTIKE